MEKKSGGPAGVTGDISGEAPGIKGNKGNGGGKGPVISVSVQV